MTVGGLFEGIGGFPLAAQWAGLTPIWSNEIDPFCCAVLRKNFKHRIIEDDIKNIGRHNLETVDILTGGFPCQPFSTAGKRKGTEDDRHLWPEMLRVIREIQPTWVVGENVRGLTNWDEGLVFDKVQSDLEIEGYEVLPFLLPACALNAPHRRDRIWIIAHSSGNGNAEKLAIRENSGREGKDKDQKEQYFRKGKDRERIRHNINGGHTEISTYSERIGQQGSRGAEGQVSSEENGNWKASWSYDDGRWPTQSPLRSRNDGLSSHLVRSAIKGAGNSIVPQVALEIFKAIKEVNNAIPQG